MGFSLSVFYLSSKCEWASFSSTISYVIGRKVYQLPQLSNLSRNRKFFNSGKESFFLRLCDYLLDASLLIGDGVLLSTLLGFGAYSYGRLEADQRD